MSIIHDEADFYLFLLVFELLKVGFGNHHPKHLGGFANIVGLLLVERVELLFLGDEKLEETVETHGIT